MSDYTDRVAANLAGLCAVSTGYCPGCQECIATYGPLSPEGHYPPTVEDFSWSSCDICGSSLGGLREPWHAIRDEPAGGEIEHYTDACVDCIAFLANGDEPMEEA